MDGLKLLIRLMWFGRYEALRSIKIKGAIQMHIVIEIGSETELYEFENRLDAMLKFNELIDLQEKMGIKKKIYIAEVERIHND